MEWVEVRPLFLFKAKNLEKTGIQEKLAEAAEAWLAGRGFELVDLQVGNEPRGRFVRFFIDKAEGVTIDDCASVNEGLSRIVEDTGIESGKYFLEISSPGIERPIKKLADYERFAGRKVKICLKEKLGDAKTIKGTIKEIKDSFVVIEDSKGLICIDFNGIAEANLEVEF